MQSDGKTAFFMVVATALAVACTTPSPASAQTIVEGRASVQMKSKCKNEQPKKVEDYNRALYDAKLNAMRSWTGQASDSFAELFESAEKEVMEDIDRYLINPNIRTRCESKTFFVQVKFEVNESALAQLMASKKPQPTGPRSRMTAVFVARQQTSVKTFDAKVVKISETEEFSEAEQSADVSGATMSASGYTSSRDVTTTGGSTTRKSDDIEWDVFTPDGLDAAVNQTFASFGYRTIEASQVSGRFPGFNLDAMRAEFAAGDSLDDETLNSAFNAIAGKIPILVIATVDVLGSQPDEVGGGVSVYVSVLAKVYQDDGLFFETIGSVGPAVEQGIGPSESVAQTQALIKAARLASTEIVNQLNAKGIY
jgi:hypothetical protein